MRRSAAIAALLLITLFGESASSAAYIYSFSASPDPSVSGKNQGLFVWNSPTLVSGNVTISASNLSSCSWIGGTCGSTTFFSDVLRIPSGVDIADAIRFNTYAYVFDNHALANPGTYAGRLVGPSGNIGDKVANLSIQNGSQGSNTYDVHLLPSGNEMFATYTPSKGLSLSEAAALGGFDHFNWYQIGLTYPGRKTPFVDPPPGGWNGQPADDLPFYWDETNGSKFSLSANIVGRTLSFDDVPADSYLIFTGGYMEFYTTLAGIRTDGSWIPLSAWKWKSNNRPLLPGGEVILQRNIDQLPDFVGNVFGVEAFANPSDVPTIVRRRWILDGATGVSGVPEPASWFMMFVGLGAIGAILRFRRPIPHASLLGVISGH